MSVGSIVSVAQMRQLEQAAIANGVSEDDLQRAAGLAVAQECWMAMGTMEGRPVLVLVGSGNNGRDALIAANHLYEYGASVFVYAATAGQVNDPIWNEIAANDIPHAFAENDQDFLELETLLERTAVVLDGLLGIGFDPKGRPIEGLYAEILYRIKIASETIPPVRIFAVDVPSGLDADTGFADPHTVASELTVTFGYAKVGHFVGDGRKFSGRTVEVDIGIPKEVIDSFEIPYQTLRLHELRKALPDRPSDGHKGTFGRLLVISGSKTYPGAARLAVDSAVRTGVGSVVLAAPASIQNVVGVLPDISHLPLTDASGFLGSHAADELLEYLTNRPPSAVLLGPGLGLNDDTRDFVQSFIGGLNEALPNGFKGLVIDADGLSALAAAGDWSTLNENHLILTPHIGEMAMISGLEKDFIRENKLSVASQFAVDTRSTVVLKGAGTVIASHDGHARLSEAATSALAHAGTGDVLAGLVGGFLAQGLTPLDAGSVAVYMHSEAGRQVSEVYGDAATLASDLIRALPDARKVLDVPETRI